MLLEPVVSANIFVIVTDNADTPYKEIVFVEGSEYGSELEAKAEEKVI